MSLPKCGNHFLTRPKADLVEQSLLHLHELISVRHKVDFYVVSVRAALVANLQKDGGLAAPLPTNKNICVAIECALIAFGLKKILRGNSLVLGRGVSTIYMFQEISGR